MEEGGGGRQRHCMRNETQDSWYDIVLSALSTSQRQVVFATRQRSSTCFASAIGFQCA